MPADHGRRLNELEVRSPRVPRTGDRRPEDAVFVTERRTALSAGIHRELLAQHQILHQQIVSRAERSADETEQETQVQSHGPPPAAHHHPRPATNLLRIGFCHPTTSPRRSCLKSRRSDCGSSVRAPRLQREGAGKARYLRRAQTARFHATESRYHCRAKTVHRRNQRTALGYRRFWCSSRRRRFNERTGTPFNDYSTRRMSCCSPCSGDCGTS